MLLAGFPHWEIEFNEDGKILNRTEVDSMVAESSGITDLLIFSHGWNNDHVGARSLYKRFFEMARIVVDARGVATGVKIGTAGVIWPSIFWPDDQPEPEAGGAAGVHAGRSADPRSALGHVFTSADQLAAIDELLDLVKRRPKEEAALKRFQQLLSALAPGGADAEDDAERALLTEPAQKVFETMADIAPEDGRSAAAGGVGDAWRKLWTGAKEAMRVTTYWHMKNRAGVVGEKGLAPVVKRLHDNPGSKVRVHLIGHSFGARLVSFSLRGLPETWVHEKSPVKSCTLIQGAFSHHAYSATLPHDLKRGGALKGMANRVDGPIIVTFSRYDKAVCERYPQASLIMRQDAAMSRDNLARFGAMGSDGAQAVEADERKFKPVGGSYPFQKSRFLNIDGNDLIRKGDGPSGAHSDIFYPEIAWAVLSGAKIAA
jgi:hypothetical protein